MYQITLFLIKNSKMGKVCFPTILCDRMFLWFNITCKSACELIMEQTDITGLLMRSTKKNTTSLRK